MLSLYQQVEAGTEDCANATKGHTKDWAWLPVLSAAHAVKAEEIKYCSMYQPGSKTNNGSNIIQKLFKLFKYYSNINKITLDPCFTCYGGRELKGSNPDVRLPKSNSLGQLLIGPHFWFYFTKLLNNSRPPLLACSASIAGLSWKPNRETGMFSSSHWPCLSEAEMLLCLRDSSPIPHVIL